MKRLFNPAVLAGALTAFLMWLPTPSLAQGGGGPGGRGNFDPAQFRQRMMDRIKENLEITSDDEWKAIEPRIQKVMDARQEAMSGMGRGLFGRGGRGPGGGGPGAAAENQGDQPRRNFGPQPSQAAQDLQKAIDGKLSTEQIKSRLTAYREDKQAKQAALEKAQEDLKKVLTLRQEAALVLSGILD